MDLSLGRVERNFTPDDLISEPATCPYCVESNFGVIYITPNWIRNTHFINDDKNFTVDIKNETALTKNSSSDPLINSWSGDRLSLKNHKYNSHISDPVINALLAGQIPTCRKVYPPNHALVVRTDHIRPGWQHILRSKKNRLRKQAASAAVLAYSVILPSGNTMVSSKDELPSRLRREQTSYLSPSSSQLETPFSRYSLNNSFHYDEQANFTYNQSRFQRQP